MSPPYTAALPPDSRAGRPTRAWTLVALALLVPALRRRARRLDGDDPRRVGAVGDRVRAQDLGAGLPLPVRDRVLLLVLRAAGTLRASAVVDVPPRVLAPRAALSGGLVPRSAAH